MDKVKWLLIEGGILSLLQTSICVRSWDINPPEEEHRYYRARAWMDLLLFTHSITEKKFLCSEQFQANSNQFDLGKKKKEKSFDGGALTPVLVSLWKPLFIVSWTFWN